MPSNFPCSYSLSSLALFIQHTFLLLGWGLMCSILELLGTKASDNSKEMVIGPYLLTSHLIWNIPSQGGCGLPGLIPREDWAIWSPFSLPAPTLQVNENIISLAPSDLRLRVNNLFCKRPDSNYLGLADDKVSVATTIVCWCNMEIAIDNDKWAWLYSTKIWISFWFFFNH